jgi:hypothetical protein
MAWIEDPHQNRSSQAFGRAISEVSEALLVPSARRVGAMIELV